MSKPLTDVNQLIDRHRDEWHASTAGVPFVSGVREGTLDTAAFERWLTQDRLFVDRLYGAQARMIALCTGAARRTLLNGLVALQEELDWFEEQGTRRGLDLDVAPTDDCLAFVDYLDALAFASPAVALVALWAVERAYLDAWSAARPGAEAYREFVDHWSHQGFEDYVAALRQGANDALADASERDRADAERAFRRVMAFERRFWQMTEGRSAP